MSRTSLFVYGWGFSIVLSSVAFSEAVVDRDESVGINEVRNAWSDDLRRPNLDVRWHHLREDGLTKFSQFQSHWAAETRDEQGSRDRFEYRMRFEGDFIRFDSQRWAAGPHTEDFVSNELIAREPLQYTAYLQKHAETGYPPEYSSNLHNQFANPKADFLPPQRFSRVFDGKQWIDTWYPNGLAYARVTFRRTLKPGSVSWARLAPEENWNDQVDTLDMQAASLAFRLVNFPFLNIQSDNLQLRPRKHRLDGIDCLVIDDIANGDRSNFRTFWVDPRPGHIIRRFIGQVKIGHSQSDAKRVGALPGRFSKTQIDIEYERDMDSNWKPNGWTVAAWAAHDYSLFAFAHSKIDSIDGFSSSSQDEPSLEGESLPKGAWVIDELTGDQYIVQGKNARRKISRAELALRPLYEDLSETTEGELVTQQPGNNSSRLLQVVLLIIGLGLIFSSVFRKYR